MKKQYKPQVQVKEKFKGQEPKTVPGGGFSDSMVEVTNAEHSKKKLFSLGNHLIIEMHDCLSERLDDIHWVEGVLVEAAKQAQATIIDIFFHKFSPIGVSGVVVIAESHIAVHTWPEYHYAAVDIFSCGKTLKGFEAAAYIIEQFRSTRPSVVEVRRGVFSSGLITGHLPSIKS